MVTGRYSEDEIWTFGEVIGRLSDEIEVTARVQLAKRDGPLENHTLSERPAWRRGLGRDHLGHGTHCKSRRENGALPLRPFGEQAILRRHARQN